MILPKPTKAPKERKRKRKHRPGTKAAERARYNRAFDACEALWSKIIKCDRGCYFAGIASPVPKEQGGPHVCSGSLQAMHGIPRGYHGVCFDTRNGIPGCGKIHSFYTHRKEEWDRWLRIYWGQDLYDELWTKALFVTRYLTVTKPDPFVTLENLRAEAARLGLAA